MDATRERMVGRAEVPMFALLQRNADALFRSPSSLDRRRTQQSGGGDEEEDQEEEEKEEEQMLPLRCVLFWGWSEEWAIADKVRFTVLLVHPCRDSAGKEVGYACVRLRLDEDSRGLFLAARPRKAPRPPEVGGC